jgi:glycosidase
MCNRRKNLDQNLLISHGETSRYFVTLLDNHDAKQSFRWVQPGDSDLYNDQLTRALACLDGLPGIPGVYCRVEQGLHGYDMDPAVREALWGITPGFSETNFFVSEMQKIVTIRQRYPALRYGRFYFRPVSGTVSISVSRTLQGVSLQGLEF